ncbi:hypothetical protein ACF3M1_08575 [Luteimonas sp. WGS1318]|uniref:hypothetical protein n=1 Tax=Luteimonas sp. WGS1318 TaxID=3366815 RepID=UPI00372D4D16
MLLLAPWLACAAQQAVHKCNDGQGGHLYQSMPCADGATLRRWEIAPSSHDGVGETRDARPAAQPAPRRATASDTLRRSASRGATTARSADPHARCVAARANREATLARLGMKRGYEDLRRLNDRVSAACNHRNVR